VPRGDAALRLHSPNGSKHGAGAVMALSHRVGRGVAPRTFHAAGLPAASEVTR
jgi:hypothetical protein